MRRTSDNHTNEKKYSPEQDDDRIIRVVRRNGVNATMKIGVRRHMNKLEAHVWVETGHAPIPFASAVNSTQATFAILSSLKNGTTVSVDSHKS